MNNDRSNLPLSEAKVDISFATTTLHTLRSPLANKFLQKREQIVGLKSQNRKFVT